MCQVLCVHRLTCSSWYPKEAVHHHCHFIAEEPELVQFAENQNISKGAKWASAYISQALHLKVFAFLLPCLLRKP